MRVLEYRQQAPLQPLTLILESGWTRGGCQRELVEMAFLLLPLIEIVIDPHEEVITIIYLFIYFLLYSMQKY